MLVPIANSTGCKVIAFEYPGYGWDSPSNISMENTIRSGHSAYEHLSKNSKVIVYGYSMGTGIAIEVIRRSQNMSQCVFLEGAFATLLSNTYAQKNLLAKILIKLNIDVLKTCNNLPRVPTYFIHGIKDNMCSAEEAQTMAKRVGTYRASLWLKDRDHYDTWKSPKYEIFLKKTLEKLLKPN
jgi:pimeloyl-ACP methyl ester carboxylesterase